MREILFRGQSIDRRKWCEGDLYQSKLKSVFFINYYTELGDRMAVEVDPETVGQYTGLTDKNGKKIFEGDILRTGTRMGYILFEKGCFRFRWKNFDKYRDDFFKTCIITEYGSFRELEVIGNIHDNPELLKGGAE